MSFDYNWGMKRIVKIMTLLVATSAFWFGLLQTSMVPRSYTWLLPLYFILSLGCYGLLMVGVGLMQFRTCPQEVVLLQQPWSPVKVVKHRKIIRVGRIRACRCAFKTGHCRGQGIPGAKRSSYQLLLIRSAKFLARKQPTTQRDILRSSDMHEYFMWIDIRKHSQLGKSSCWNFCVLALNMPLLTVLSCHVN